MKAKLFLGLLLLAIASPVFARIGENKMNLESRLLTRVDGALRYEKEEDRVREMMELHYKNLFLIMPKETYHAFYFKRSDVQAALPADVVKQNDLDGWELHTIYVKDKSVLETYRKYGIFTPEELLEMMKIMAPENVEWVPSERFVNKDAATNDPAEIPIAQKESDDPKIAALCKILPKPRVREIALEIPEEIQNSPALRQMLRNSLITDEQRRANERYRSEVREKASQNAARTAQTRNSSTRKSDTKSEQPKASDMNLSDLSTSTTAAARGKEIKILENIPSQNDTAFGYNYVTSDGKIRARLLLTNNIPTGVIFFDTEFDRNLRRAMEDLYETQTSERERSAIESIFKF